MELESSTRNAAVYRLWFRPGARALWRVVAEADTQIEANARMHELLDDGHASGDWYVAAAGIDPNRPNARRASA